MDYLDELQRLRHQLELANRAMAFVRDRLTVERLEKFAEEITGRLNALERAGFPADFRSARPLPLSPQGDAVLRRENSMPEVYEDDIRARAYKLWEEAGKPEGRVDEFWHEAEQQLKNEQVKHELKTPDTL